MYLTRRQRDVYHYIRRFIKKNGFSPTLEEICSGLGVSSLATVFKHLKNLEEKGVITRKWNHGRSIEIQAPLDIPRMMELPLLGFVAKGKPIEPSGNRRTVGVPEDYLRGTENFVLKVKDDSMQGDLFRRGDCLIVERRSIARNGEMVVAITGEDRVIVGRYREEKGRVFLIPGAVDSKPDLLCSGNIRVRGIVVGVLRRYD